MDKIRTGLAAYGMSGRVFHAPFISTNPHFELTAVTERSKELSREKYPDACIVRSFEELIGLEGLDLVVINTPDSTHYEYARRALEAGKHVVVEGNDLIVRILENHSGGLSHRNDILLFRNIHAVHKKTTLGRG